MILTVLTPTDTVVFECNKKSTAVLAHVRRPTHTPDTQTPNHQELSLDTPKTT